MKRYLFCLFFSLNVFADPFYAENSAEKKAESINHHTQTTACQPNTKVEKIYTSINFHQLKLIGLIELDGNFKALFTNGENHLIILKTNDYIISSGIQITQIDLKSVSFIDWQNTIICEEPNTLQRQL